MRGLRHYGPFILLFLVGLIGFAALTSHIAFADASAGSDSDTIIPHEAIRIRIIANSDSKVDQATKLEVRDRVAELIESWGPMPDTIDKARKLIRSHLKDVQRTADRVLTKDKAPYGAKVALAKVPFPVKTFDGKKYPAGNYEALRVTLGDGKGANWWCVLFPPLCLTAATSADGKDAAKDNGKAVAASVKGDTSKGKTAHANPSQPDKPHVKFFLWVLLEKLIAFLRSLFS